MSPPAPPTKPRRARVGLWNVEHGRHDRTVARHCRRLLLLHDLDALLLSETREYARELNQQPGCRFLHFAEEDGQADTGILVRHDVTIRGLGIARMTRTGWFTAGRGRRTPPKWMPHVVLNGWLRVGSLHRAPSVRFDGDRTPEGPARRVDSTVDHAQAELRFAHRHPGPLVLGGDFNDTPSDRGRFSPFWVAEQTGMDLVAPPRPTHGRRRIDYALTRGVTGSCTVQPQPGSKHHLVVYDLTEETR